MGYRGEDLDLRTPQTWAGPPADLAAGADLSVSQNGGRPSYRLGPILVDDTVLACCNQAYEMAAAHRAAEVRIEHLLNAMTRIDAAAATLEARGVRVGALRRETATVIASEIPAVAGNAPTSPRRSEEFAQALRLSADHAARRNAAVTIDDLMHVLIDQRLELPGAELLYRFASRLALRDGPEPLPPLTRSGPELRYPAGTRYGLEGTRYLRGEYPNGPTDAIQNSRIEALEQMVRALSQDLSNERHIVAGLVRDLSRDTQAHQDDQGRRQALLLDRIGTLEEAVQSARGSGGESLIAKLQDIEAGLELRLQEMSQSWSVLSDRLQELEIAVRDRPNHDGPGASVEQIREIIHAGPIADLGNRFAKFESDLAKFSIPNDGGSGEATAGALDQFKALLERFESARSALNQSSSTLIERMDAIEGAVKAEIETAAAKHQAYTHDLTEVHDALMKLNQNQHTLAGSMDQWRTEAAADVASILNRIAGLDRDASVPVETLTALNAQMEALNRFVVEGQHRRHGFWYWLFGTNDWVRASWPSRKRGVDAERQAITGDQTEI